MSKRTDYLDPETLFSRENPFLKSVEKTQQLIFGTVDKAARVQLAFAEDLLDLNREGFEALTRRQSLTELFTAQQDLLTELGKRAARYAGDLQEVATAVKAEVANEMSAAVEPKTPRTKSKKAA
jgi:hypothetical protein